MPDKFPTAYYEANDYLVCPNGDKVRSDDEGLFCWIDGARVPAIALNGVITLQQIVEPVVASVGIASTSSKKKKASTTTTEEQQQEQQEKQTDANG